MIFTVHMSTSEEDSRAVAAILRWAELARVPVDARVLVPGTASPPGSGVLIWDLESPEPLPEELFTGGRRRPLLVLCAAGSGMAIGSYAVHPAGFLKKPVRLADLKRLLDRYIARWHDELERVEVMCGGTRRSIPLYDLIWAESNRHGAILHTHCEGLQTRESLRDLSERLPEGVFLRCQRSFLVNRYHVRELRGGGVRLDNGRDVPVGRSMRDSVCSAVQELAQIWDQSVTQ